MNKVGFQQELSVIEKDGYIVANVTIENRDKKSQSYSFTQWKVQTPNGEVIDATITSKNSASGLSADLVSGGKTTTDVVFKVGQTKGDFYIIYKPDFL